MKLKGGSMVEVCRRNEGPFGSWYRARIISVDGQRYKVQYENILDVDRKSVVEEVYSEATRPVPPSMKGLGNWVAGDTIEVYDHHSWKIGKIVKVLPGNFFIVKLLESRRERTCHQSNLRPRLSWQDGKWLCAQQAARNHYVRLEASQERVSFAAFSQESHAGLQLQDLDVQIGAGNRKNGLTKTDSYLCKPLTSHVSLKATKRKPGIQMQSAYKEDFFNMEAAPQKRRAIQKSRNHEAMGESSRPLLEKPYPGLLTGGVEADVMAANELATHAFLQDVPDENFCSNLQILLGGFQTRTGEQWLVFRDDGRITAANYAKAAIEATTEGRAVGEWEFWDRFDRSQPIKRRQIFIIKLLRGAFTGLSYLHSRDRLHQSLGPASIILNTIEERDVRYLVPRLRDLAFAVDISDRAIFGAKDLGFSSIRPSSSVSSGDISLETAAEAQSEGLWRRAVSSGAFTPLEKKAFGISDDIYAAGLLLAYMAFIPLCEKGSIDGPSLQRLLESTFQLDIQSVREYCQADDRWSEALNFLDLDNRAGWELLQAMLNPDFRLRPTAQAVLSHRFMTRIL